MLALDAERLVALEPGALPAWAEVPRRPWDPAPHGADVLTNWAECLGAPIFRVWWLPLPSHRIFDSDGRGSHFLA